MTPHLSIPTAKHDFEAFLFAPIGEERNGMALSVLSGLSRLDVDPWDEAARLSQLPKEHAVAALGQRLGRLPPGAWLLSDTTVIAARLVELLPKHDPHVRATPSNPRPDGKKPFKSLALWLIAACIAVFLLLFALPTRVERPVAGDGAVAPILTPAGPAAPSP